MAGELIERALESIRSQKERELSRLKWRAREQRRRVRLARQEAYRQALEVLDITLDRCWQRLAQIERKATSFPKDRAQLAELEKEIRRAMASAESAGRIVGEALSRLSLTD